MINAGWVLLRPKVLKIIFKDNALFFTIKLWELKIPNAFVYFMIH